MEIGWAVVLLVSLLLGSAVGVWFQARLREHHRSTSTIESIRLIVTMLVTFAALVLGLLVNSVKADFDAHSDLYRKYAIALIRVDLRLRELGSKADTSRALLRIYTASAIAATWPEETLPAGVYSPDLNPTAYNDNETIRLTALMTQIDEEIQHIVPSGDYEQRIAALAQEDIRAAAEQRWTLVENSHSKISIIFLLVLTSWLFILFLIFGIISPANILTISVTCLSALIVASSLYLILDLDTPVGGFIKIPSQPLRDALWHMDQPNAVGSTLPPP